MNYNFKDTTPLDEVLEQEGYYNDWTHLDPEVFYSLTQISDYIKTKGYGVDVRLLIAQLAEHFGLRVTQITEAMTEFNDLKPKAELSVSQSAEALTKSQNALNVANGIDAKATNALSLSESADTLSQSVQEQFNQVVIDGDSSVEAAQARVDANGEVNVTLKARLDKEHTEVTTQLEQMTTSIGAFNKNADEEDGTFINRVISHIYDSGGRTLLLEKDGNYKINETIFLPRFFKLDMNNATFDVIANVDVILSDDRANLKNGTINVFNVPNDFDKVVLKYVRGGQISRSIYKDLYIVGSWTNTVKTGTAIEMYRDGADESMINNTFEDVYIFNFEYAIKMAVGDSYDENGNGAWINANFFLGVRIDGCKHMVVLDGAPYDEGDSTAEISGNMFRNITLQCHAVTENVINVKGQGNYFDGYIWDEHKPIANIDTIIANEKARDNVFNFPFIRDTRKDVDTHKNTVYNYPYNYGNPTNFDRLSIPSIPTKPTFAGHQDNFFSYLDKRYTIDFFGNEPTYPERMFIPNGHPTIFQTNRNQVVGFEVDFSKKPVRFLELIGIVTDSTVSTPIKHKVILTYDNDMMDEYEIGNNESYYQLFNINKPNRDYHVKKMRIEITSGGSRVNIVNVFGVATYEKGETYVDKYGASIIGNLRFESEKSRITMKSDDGTAYSIGVNNDGELIVFPL